MTCGKKVAKLLGRKLTPLEAAFVKDACAFNADNGWAAYVSLIRHIRFKDLKNVLITLGITSTEFDASIHRILDLFRQGKDATEIARVLKSEKAERNRPAAKSLRDSMSKMSPELIAVSDAWLTWHAQVDDELDEAVAGLDPPASPDELELASKRIAAGAKGFDINAELKAQRPVMERAAIDSIAVDKKV